MNIDSFIGNKSQIIVITNWLNDYYHQTSDIIPNYCIITSASGNGKTFLVNLLAKDFGVELFAITPLDATKIDDIIKSINIMPLDGSKYKLILVDDIDEFPVNVRKKLYEIGNISKHPIIFTAKSTSFPVEFIEGSLKRNKNTKQLIRLEKPLDEDLLKHLKTISNLGTPILEKIAKESKSMRSAILATYNQSPNEVSNPSLQLREYLASIKARKLTKSLDRGDIGFLFSCIQGYDSNALDVMKRFANFDYRNKVQYQKIKPYFVNNMIEPISQIQLQYKKPLVDKVVIEKKKPKKEKIKIQVKPASSISKWI